MIYIYIYIYILPPLPPLSLPLALYPSREFLATLRIMHSGHLGTELCDIYIYIYIYISVPPLYLVCRITERSLPGVRGARGRSQPGVREQF